MPSTYSSNLKIELIGTGEQAGVWGATTNNNFTNVFEQAITGRGTATFTLDADLTLTYTDSVSSQTARNLYLNAVSTVVGGLTTTRNLIVPTINKTYVVQNNTTGSQSIVVKTSAGTGITIPNGYACALYVNGTDVIQASNYVPVALIGTLTLTNALGATSGGTGQSSYATGDLIYASGSTALSKLPIGTANYFLSSSGTAPQWTQTLGAANGGTGINSYNAGDLIYASASTTLAKLGIGANGQFLTVTGGALAWGSAGGGTTTSTLTITTTGGAAAPATFNGSAPVTIDYSTVGADQAGTAVALAIALG